MCCNSSLFGLGFWAIGRFPTDTDARGTFWMSGGYTFAVRPDGIRMQANGNRSCELMGLGYVEREFNRAA